MFQRTLLSQFKHQYSYIMESRTVEEEGYDRHLQKWRDISITISNTVGFGVCLLVTDIHPKPVESSKVWNQTAKINVGPNVSILHLCSKHSNSCRNLCPLTDVSFQICLEVFGSLNLKSALHECRMYDILWKNFSLFTQQLPEYLKMH